MEKCKGITIHGKGCERTCRRNGYCFQHDSIGFRENKPSECPVCTESMHAEKRALACGHWVHLQCIINSANATCPICRSKLTFGKRVCKQIAIKARERNMEIIREQEEQLLQDYYSETNTDLYDQIYTIVALLLDDPDQITNEIMDQLASFGNT